MPWKRIKLKGSGRLGGPARTYATNTRRPNLPRPNVCRPNCRSGALMATVDAKDQKALDDIDRYGCHVLHIFEEDNLPCFSYSIGIQKTSNRPELIVTGLKSDLAHWIINEYNRRVRAGDVFEADRPYDGFIEGFDVMFKSVEKSHDREYFGWARWLYSADNFDALQLVHPSTVGVWPWEETASEQFKWAIPPLYAT